MKPATPRRSEPGKLTSGSALAELEAQHEVLRGLTDRCEELADGLEAGTLDPDQLTREIVKLRLAFETHNTFEERLLRPAMLDEDAFTAVRIDRMVEDHVGEHRAIYTQLGATETRILRETLAMLRAHLAAEECYLLDTRV